MKSPFLRSSSLLLRYKRSLIIHLPDVFVLSVLLQDEDVDAASHLVYS